MSFVRPAILAAIALLIAACSTGAPAAGGPTPPAGVTSAPGATQAPGATSVPGATSATGGGAGSGTCALVTAADLSAIFSDTFNITDTSDNSCTYIATSSLTNVSIRFDNTSLAVAHQLMGTTATDVTVAGNPGVIGAFMGLILYVQHGGQTLVIQTVLLDDTPANRDKVVAVATKALSRLP